MKARRKVVTSMRGPGSSVMLLAIVLSLQVSSFDGICEATKTAIGATEGVMLISLPVLCFRPGLTPEPH